MLKKGILLVVIFFILSSCQNEFNKNKTNQDNDDNSPSITNNDEAQQNESSAGSGYKNEYRTVNDGSQGNQNLDKSEFQVSINGLVDFDYLEQENAELRLAEYMSYEEYLNVFEAVTSAGISPNQHVLVIQVYYPEGYEHPKAGLITHAIATGVYDAVTGEYLGGSYKSVEEFDFNPREVEQGESKDTDGASSDTDRINESDGIFDPEDIAVGDQVGKFYVSEFNIERDDNNEINSYEVQFGGEVLLEGKVVVDNAYGGYLFIVDGSYYKSFPHKVEHLKDNNQVLFKINNPDELEEVLGDSLTDLSAEDSLSLKAVFSNYSIHFLTESHGTRNADFVKVVNEKNQTS